MDVATFRELRRRVEDGSENAIAEFVSEFGNEVLRNVRGGIDPEMRGLIDSDDVAQSVWAAILRNPRQLLEFETPKELKQFLGTVARNKLVKERRRSEAQKRRPSYDAAAAAMQKRQETPSESLQLADTVEWVLEQRDPSHRKMFEMRRDGATFEDIAEETGVSARTVQRIIRDIMDEVR